MVSLRRNGLSDGARLLIKLQISPLPAKADVSVTPALVYRPGPQPSWSAACSPTCISVVGGTAWLGRHRQ
jgi:hypothetical protein